MAEVPFRPVRQLSEYKGKGASASREIKEQRNLKTVRKLIARRSHLYKGNIPKQEA